MCEVFSQEKNIEGVMHFAAFSLVDESMGEPLKYFNKRTALEAMKLLARFYFQPFIPLFAGQ
ncbi:hypothetical protein [Bacillus paranthracis]|uniref:hypothetical protein n=1 Tax=Bacillus paranthracis TaxID=2026186 RepID=UPI0020B71D2D|nr:hypothetical protein MON10_15030 [Bacillus paranthracis]